MGNFRNNSRIVTYIAFICLAPAIFAQQPCVVFERTVSDCAMPGSELTVTISVTSGCGDSLTALGLRETLPDGWTFNGIVDGGASPPALVSNDGALDLAEFAWVDLPTFPATFSYSLLVPQSENGSRAISGNLLFREGAGEEVGTTVATNVCFESGGGEGEGEGEGEPDPNVPVIVLVGNSTVELECGEPYVEEGATASDMQDGDLSANIVRSGFVNTQSSGTYVVTYNVNDSDDNQAPQVARTVIVRDTVAPTVMLNGAEFLTQACGNNYIELGATAMDACDGALGVSITGEVDVEQPGTYVLIYSARDRAGLNASVTRTVTVEDTVGPLITLIGTAPMIVECNTPYEEPGAIAVDACDGLMYDVTIENNTIDTSVEGTHTVRYRATDANGFQSAVTRQVVVMDTEPPVISLLGDDPLVLDCGSVFIDPNAMAVDLCDGDVTVSSDAFSLVDTSEANTVEVTYSARDTNGNVAFASRVVTVQGPACGGGTAFCPVVAYSVTQPLPTNGLASVVIPDGAQSGRVLFTADAALSGAAGCTPGTVEVSYNVDGSVQTSRLASAGYPAVYFLGEGQHTVQTMATVVENGTSRSENYTLNVTTAPDTDNNGFIDTPFAALLLDGESWTASTEAGGDEGIVSMTAVHGECPGTSRDPLVLRVRNPENANQVITVELARALFECGEQGIVTIAAGEQLANIFGAVEAARIPAPPEGTASGAPYFDISIVVSADGGNSFEPLSATRLAANPVQFSITGITIVDANSAGVAHYPASAAANGNGGFELVPGTGSWTDVPAANITVSGDTITGQTANLSLFAAVSGIEIPAKEGGPSCGPRKTGADGVILDLLCMAAVLGLLMRAGRRSTHRVVR